MIVNTNTVTPKKHNIPTSDLEMKEVRNDNLALLGLLHKFNSAVLNVFR